MFMLTVIIKALVKCTIALGCVCSAMELLIILSVAQGVVSRAVFKDVMTVSISQHVYHVMEMKVIIWMEKPAPFVILQLTCFLMEGAQVAPHAIYQAALIVKTIHTVFSVMKPTTSTFRMILVITVTTPWMSS